MFFYTITECCNVLKSLSMNCYTLKSPSFLPLFLPALLFAPLRFTSRQFFEQAPWMLVTWLCLVVTCLLTWPAAFVDPHHIAPDLVPCLRTEGVATVLERVFYRPRGRDLVKITKVSPPPPQSYLKEKKEKYLLQASSLSLEMPRCKTRLLLGNNPCFLFLDLLISQNDRLKVHVTAGCSQHNLEQIETYLVFNDYSHVASKV